MKVYQLHVSSCLTTVPCHPHPSISPWYLGASRSFPVMLRTMSFYVLLLPDHHQLCPWGYSLARAHMPSAKWADSSQPKDTTTIRRPWSRARSGSTDPPLPSSKLEAVTLHNTAWSLNAQRPPSRKAATRAAAWIFAITPHFCPCFSVHYSPNSSQFGPVKT